MRTPCPVLTLLSPFIRSGRFFFVLYSVSSFSIFFSFLGSCLFVVFFFLGGLSKIALHLLWSCPLRILCRLPPQSLMPARDFRYLPVIFLLNFELPLLRDLLRVSLCSREEPATERAHPSWHKGFVCCSSPFFDQSVRYICGCHPRRASSFFAFSLFYEASPSLFLSFGPLTLRGDPRPIFCRPGCFFLLSSLGRAGFCRDFFAGS